MVTLELLRAVATPQEEPPTNKSCQHSGSRLDVPAYLAKYNIECIGVKQRGTSTLYLLKHCLFDPSHSGGEAAIGQTEDGTLFYFCFHDSCKGRTWHDARQVISGSDRLIEKPSSHSAGANSSTKETAADEPPIIIISGSDLISTDLGPDNPVIDKLLGEKESLLLTGASGIGKSLFVNNVALILGNPPLTGLWGMFPIPKAVNSIFVQSENSAKATQRRLRMIMEGAPYLRGGINRIFYPMIKDDIRLIGDLQEPIFQEQLKEIIAATKAGLLIIDPLISYHWKDENSNSDMRRTLDCLTLISEDTGAACLVVHHVGKNGMSARGASAIEDWAANILALEEVTRHDKTFIQATHKKSRNFDRVQQFFLERTRYLELLKADPQEVAGVIDVLEALKDAGGKVSKKSDFIELVVERMNCSEVTARRAIAKAQTGGLVVESKTGRNKSFKLSNSDHDPGIVITLIVINKG